jgi:hypothetical protein
MKDLIQKTLLRYITNENPDTFVDDTAEWLGKEPTPDELELIRIIYYMTNKAGFHYQWLYERYDIQEVLGLENIFQQVDRTHGDMIVHHAQVAQSLVADIESESFAKRWQGTQREQAKVKHVRAYQEACGDLGVLYNFAVLNHGSSMDVVGNLRLQLAQVREAHKRMHEGAPKGFVGWPVERFPRHKFLSHYMGVLEAVDEQEYEEFDASAAAAANPQSSHYSAEDLSDWLDDVLKLELDCVKAFELQGVKVFWELLDHQIAGDYGKIEQGELSESDLVIAFAKQMDDFAEMNEYGDYFTTVGELNDFIEELSKLVRAYQSQATEVQVLPAASVRLGSLPKAPKAVGMQKLDFGDPELEAAILASLQTY